MAATITTKFKHNGATKFVAEIQITGDAAGDVTNQAVVDSTAVIAGIQAASGMPGAPKVWKINSIDWEFTGFTGTLIWDGATPQQACALPQYDGRLDLSAVGPIVNGATTPTGKLLLSTKGLAAGYSGTIIIKGRHK